MTTAVEQTRLEIVDPETGEVIDLRALTDAEIDELHMVLQYHIDEYRRLERLVWHEMRRRAVEQGGLDGRYRRWTVKRVTTIEATPQMKEGE